MPVSTGAAADLNGGRCHVPGQVNVNVTVRTVQVKVTSSTKHLAVVIEVFAVAADPTGSMASGASGAISGAVCRGPAATAHSANLDQLPAPEALSDRSLAAIALHAAAAERAFVIRCGDEDWAVVIGVPARMHEVSRRRFGRTCRLLPRPHAVAAAWCRHNTPETVLQLVGGSGWLGVGRDRSRGGWALDGSMGWVNRSQHGKRNNFDKGGGGGGSAVWSVCCAC